MEKGRKNTFKGLCHSWTFVK